MSKSDDLISRQTAIDALQKEINKVIPPFDDVMGSIRCGVRLARNIIEDLPSAQPEIIRCKDCKHWTQQTNYAGAPLSFGFCESDDMWRSLYGETYEVSHIDTDDNFYCGYAERRMI